MIGGTFFEVVYVRDKLEEYKRWLTDLGLTHVEISDGTVEIPRERKLELIADFARDFTVLSEVGSKDSDVVFAPYQWVQWLREEKEAGAWKVITEAREGGSAGIFRKDGDMRTGLIDEIAHELDFHDIVWEAPTKASQAWFVKHFGPEVNLGNIPPEEVIPLETLRLGLRGDTLRRCSLATPSLLLPEETITAEDLLVWGYEQFGDRFCLTCSWQKQSSVLIHMVAELGLPIDVVELDTQLFFRESYDTRDRLLERYPVTLVQPARDHRRGAAPAGGPEPLGARPGPLLRDPQGRAARPRARAVRRLGVRHPPRPVAEPGRARQKVEWSERYGVWKLHPLADWDEKRVWAYIQVNEIPYNPLHETGYRSIGCIPCTRPTTPEEEERAGRWAGSDKFECGIHTERNE